MLIILCENNIKEVVPIKTIMPVITKNDNANNFFGSIFHNRYDQKPEIFNHKNKQYEKLLDTIEIFMKHFHDNSESLDSFCKTPQEIISFFIVLQEFMIFIANDNHYNKICLERKAFADNVKRQAIFNVFNKKNFNIFFNAVIKFDVGNMPTYIRYFVQSLIDLIKRLNENNNSILHNKENFHLVNETLKEILEKLKQLSHNKKSLSISQLSSPYDNAIYDLMENMKQYFDDHKQEPSSRKYLFDTLKTVKELHNVNNKYLNQPGVIKKIFTSLKTILPPVIIAFFCVAIYKNKDDLKKYVAKRKILNDLKNNKSSNLDEKIEHKPQNKIETQKSNL